MKYLCIFIYRQAYAVETNTSFLLYPMSLSEKTNKKPCSLTQLASLSLLLGEVTNNNYDDDAKSYFFEVRKKKFNSFGVQVFINCLKHRMDHLKTLCKLRTVVQC